MEIKGRKCIGAPLKYYFNAAQRRGSVGPVR